MTRPGRSLLVSAGRVYRGPAGPVRKLAAGLVSVVVSRARTWAAMILWAGQQGAPTGSQIVICLCLCDHGGERSRWVRRVNPQRVASAAQVPQRFAHPLDGRGGLPATSAGERLPGPDGVAHQGIQEPLPVRPGPVRLAGGGEIGVRKPAVNDADAG